MNTVPARAFVGLGSNLNQPVQQLLRALAELEGLPDTRFVTRSRLYRNPPMGPQDQPPYINAVAALDTTLRPRQLLVALRAMEDAHGRVRDSRSRWGPRTLDLDILVHGGETIDEPDLVVPHPGVPVRPFVLLPLSEIAPELVIPGFGSVSALLAVCDVSMLRALDGAVATRMSRKAG